jgi:phosphatidylserine synthase
MATTSRRLRDLTIGFIAELALLLWVVLVFWDSNSSSGVGFVIFFFACIFPYQMIVNWKFERLEARIHELETQLQQTNTTDEPQPPTN